MELLMLGINVIKPTKNLKRNTGNKYYLYESIKDYGFINPNDFLDLTVCAFDQIGTLYTLQNLEIYVGGDLVRSYVNYDVRKHTEPIISKSVPYFIDNLV